MRAASLLLASARRRAGDALILSLSSALSVLAVAVFAAAAGAPRFSVLVAGSSSIAETVRRLFGAASAALAFSVALSGWFYAEHYLKRRKREIASWLLLGMGKGEALAAISAELAVAAALALLLGLGLAAAFARLFGLLLAALMADRKPVEIGIGGKAIVAASAAAGGEWLGASLRAAYDVSRSSILSLMQAERELERPPRLRGLRTAAGLASIGLAYSAALFSKGSSAERLMLPVLGLTILGTFLLFEAAAPSLFEALRQSRARGRRGPGGGAAALIAAAQLSFRARRNARLFALSAVAVAIAASAFGAVLALDLRDGAAARRLCPHDIELGMPRPGAAAEVEAILARHGARGARRGEICWVEAELEGVASPRGSAESMPAQVFAASDWAAGLRALGERASAVPAGGLRSYLAGRELAASGRAEELALSAGKARLVLRAEPGEALPPISVVNAKGFSVVDDGAFAALRAGAEAGGASLGRALYWDGVPPEAARAAGPELKASFPTGLVARSILLDEEAGLYGVMRFIGAFIAASYAIFAASLIAFRVVEDAKDDAERYRLIARIGADREILSASLRHQNLFAFGLPAAVGLSHAAVALVMMRNISGYSNVAPTLVVSPLVLACFAAFTVLATERQTRSIGELAQGD